MARGAVGHRFFYLPLCAGKEGTAQRNGERREFGIGCIDHVIVHYGVREFIAEIDAGRSFAEGGVIGSVLRQAATVSFEEVFARFGWKYKTARDFRERNLLTFIESFRGQNG